MSEIVFEDKWEDRDVTVRITGEAARYLRRMSLNNGITMRGLAEDIIYHHARRQAEAVKEEAKR